MNNKINPDRMKKLCFLLIITLFSGYALAQNENKLSGIVLDTKGKPVKNVTLLVLRTNQSVKTKKDGLFAFSFVQPDDSVRVTVKKNKFTQFRIGEMSHITLEILNNDMNLMTEGGKSQTFRFEQIRRNAASGSLITEEMISKKSYRSLRDILTEYAPYITYTNGNDGTEALIRGTSSFSLSNGALVLLNGGEVSFDTADSSLNIHDIKSIEVNKTGSGYGVRGANGVIIIKTK